MAESKTPKTKKLATKSKTAGKASASFTDEERAVAERLHALVGTTAPDLAPRTW